MPIEFNYTTFYNYFTQIGEDTSEIKVHLYNADYSANKYDNNDHVQRFNYRGVVVRKLPNTHPIVAHHQNVYPFGCFITFPEKAKPQKELYIVSPQLFTIPSGQHILTGDHFSFVVNKTSNPNKALHFHKTEYIPSYTNVAKGNARRLPSPMPKSFILTPSSLKRNLGGQLEGYIEPLYTIFRLPWHGHSDSPNAEHVGGTSHQSIVRRRTAIHKNRKFKDLWRSLPIHKMVVICIKDIIDNTEFMHVTVFAYDRLHHKTDWRVARYLRLPVTDMQNVPKLETAIARAFEGMQWDDFKEAPQPDFPLWGA